MALGVWRVLLTAFGKSMVPFSSTARPGWNFKLLMLGVGWASMNMLL